MSRTASDWIARLQLQPHPEGGYFRRVYTDPRVCPTPDGERAYASSIHYLLDRASPLGRLHRNRSTILHYLQHGGPVDYVLLFADGRRRDVRLDFGAELFLAVPGGVWKGSRLGPGADHALVSEVVLPGFDFADHEFMSADELQRHYPAEAASLLDRVRPAIPG